MILLRGICNVSQSQNRPKPVADTQHNWCSLWMRLMGGDPSVEKVV